jgi:hypothetical protein
MAGVHDLPHVNRAGSVGTALKSKNVTMLSKVNIAIIRRMRRTMYGNI